MANTVAKVMTSLLLLHEGRTEEQQQQYVRYVTFDWFTYQSPASILHCFDLGPKIRKRDVK